METWNPVIGCSRISEGCKLCYAFTMAQKFTSWGDYSKARKSKKYTAILNTKLFPAREDIFLGTLIDFFHKDIDQYRAELMIVTKHIDRFSINLPSGWPNSFPHVRIACPAENQQIQSSKSQKSG